MGFKKEREITMEDNEDRELTREEIVAKKANKQSNRDMKFSTDMKVRTKKIITRVFVESLKYIEIKFGTDFDGYEEIRSAILRIGNDAIRDMHTEIDNYKIERLPEIILGKGK